MSKTKEFKIEPETNLLMNLEDNLFPKSIEVIRDKAVDYQSLTCQFEFERLLIRINDSELLISKKGSHSRD